MRSDELWEWHCSLQKYKLHEFQAVVCLSLSPLLQSEGRRMAPNGSCLGMILIKLKWIEWAGRRKRTTTILKENLKLGETNWYIIILGYQNDPMSQPNLYSTPLGKNITNGTTPPIDSIPVESKTPEPTSPALPKIYQGTQIQTRHCQIHQRNLIFWMTPIKVNQRKRNAIRRKNVRKTRKMTFQTYNLVMILIRLTIVITDTKCVRGRKTRKSIR